LVWQPYFAEASYGLISREFILREVRGHLVLTVKKLSLKLLPD